MINEAHPDAALDAFMKLLLPIIDKQAPVKKLTVRTVFCCFFSPLFNQGGKLRTSSHLQLQPGQDKAKQFDTYNDTELHME